MALQENVNKSFVVVLKKKEKLQQKKILIDDWNFVKASLDIVTAIPIFQIVSHFRMKQHFT